MAKTNDKTTVVKPNWLQIEHLQPRTQEGAPLLVIGMANAADPQSALNEYEHKRMCPHVTLDINTGQLYQHIPFEFAALTVPEPVAFKPAFTTTSYWLMLGCLAGHILTEDQVKTVAKVVKDLAKKLEVPLEFSDFPPPQSSVALSSVVNATQWEESGGVIASTITPNSHWPSMQQCCADAIQVELKLKKRLDIPTAEEVTFPQPEPEPAVDEDAESAKMAEDLENSKVTEALEEMVKASEEKKKAPAKKKAASTKKAEPKKESPEEPASEEASE
jgi:hypothetical protein